MTKEELFQSVLKNEIALSGNIKTYPAGSVILNFNSYIMSIPIVLSGSCKVIRIDNDGREILLYYLKPGESCIMSFLAGIHNDKSKIKAVVEEDVELLLIPVDKAKEWITKYPEWTDFILTLYQKRFEELLNVVTSVAFEKVDIRLLHLLNQKASLYKTRNLSITHQQLADELGISREAVSRVLKQMEKNKIITLSRNKITLV